MKNQLLFALLWISCLSAYAQYEKNPLEEAQWLSISGGMNTADYRSWQGMATYSYRSDVMLTQYRLGFSQELMEGPSDSIFYKKNRIIEAGILWGDAFTKKNWYISGGLGMGLNIRMYGDSAVQSDSSFRYLTAVTIGIPAQIETGFWISPNAGIGASVIANWNFRQPYVGAHLHFVYRFRKK